MPFTRRQFIKLSTAALTAPLLWPARLWAGTPPVLPEPTPQKLPRWRGFNLLEKFNVKNLRPFVESDFAWLAGWGFNFVRLPMDYRCWAATPTAEFHEPSLREIDQAVEFGRKYGVHVNLNFHHAPGYCVSLPEAQCTLWTDPAMQAQFARHWGVFAKRYQGVPNRQLSFDLVNEPSGVSNATYAAVAAQAVAAIRAEDPARLIVADGNQYGTKPVPELVSLGLAQSTRGYEPMLVSHYRAQWVPKSDQFPVPVWPIPLGLNRHLYGAGKPQLQTPLVLKVNCRTASRLGIQVAHVSVQAELIVRADGKIVLQKMFTPAAGAGEWKNSTPNKSGGFEADYDLTCHAELPAGTREIRVEIGQGVALTFAVLQFGDVKITPTDQRWGVPQETFAIDETGRFQPVKERWLHSRETLRKSMVEPWQKLAAQGVGVHVGEWGVFNQTPHAVALAWMRDCLTNWQAAGWGWALWNLRGKFGILDSERADVQYEEFNGHKLDREMLELLREF
jgi:Cellulase (glycosyl hydrolase family 5)